MQTGRIDILMPISWDPDSHEFTYAYCLAHGEWYHYEKRNNKWIKICDYCGQVVI
ncbi:MAG: hypothetical protein QXH07_06235 [Thermoplasmata archaeon]